METYKILQFATTGWEVAYTNVTKERALKILEANIADGVNPAHMKVLKEEPTQDD